MATSTSAEPQDKATVVADAIKDALKDFDNTTIDDGILNDQIKEGLFRYVRPRTEADDEEENNGESNGKTGSRAKKKK